MPMKALKALGKRMVGAGKKKSSKPPVSRPGSPDPSKVRVGINPPKSGLSGGHKLAEGAMGSMKKMLGKTAGESGRVQTAVPRAKASYNDETNRVTVSRPKKK